MSLLTVKLNVRGLKKFNSQIAELAKQAENLGPWIDDAAAYMVNVTKNRILRTKKGPDGEPWAPLSSLTEQLKGSSTILFETGKLGRSIQRQQANRRGFSIVSTANHAPYMHYGVKKPKGWIRKPDGSFVRPGPIPARPFMGFSDENVRRITKMLRQHIAGEKIQQSYAEGFE